MKQKSIVLTMIVFVTAGLWALLPVFCEDDNQCYEIKYDVTLVPQQTSMSCWAAGFSMLVGWRDQVSVDPAKIAEPLGYKEQYNKKGLDPQDTAVINHWDLETGEPMCYSMKGFKDLLENYGPLWVATNALSPHIRVVTGMYWDGTPDGTLLYINDPWETGMNKFKSSNKGSAYKKTFTEFMKEMDGLAHSELIQQKLKNPIYIVHCKAYDSSDDDDTGE